MVSKIRIILLFSTLLTIYTLKIEQQPAYPTVEGWGGYTIGVRGIKMYEVININVGRPGRFCQRINDFIPSEYDPLGREIKTPFNKEKSIGKHDIRCESEHLSDSY